MNSETGLQVNVRRGTQADIPFIAWCNYEASSPEPGFCYWDPLLEGLGTPTMTFIEAVFSARALAWGNPEAFFIADREGESIAGASGFEMNADDYRPLREEQLPKLATMLDWDADALTTFRKRYEAVWHDPHDVSIAPSARWTIECVATKPAYRGKGVAKQVLRALLAEGKARGHEHAGISVTIGNEPAQRVYESIGFQPYISYGSEYFDGQFPGTIKYRVRL